MVSPAYVGDTNEIMLYQFPPRANLGRCIRASVVRMSVLHHAFVRRFNVVRGDVIRHLKQVGIVLELCADCSHVFKDKEHFNKESVAS